jgi:geranylgeranyl pyrophosphate synthase
MYFIPLLSLSENIGKLSEEKARRIYEIYVHEMTNLSLGQAIDIAWHKKLISTSNTSQEQYLQMCAYKTGTLARMAAKMAAVISDVGSEEVEKIGKFAESIGIAFQIQDDILDIIGEKFAEGKGGLGMDITEGKLSIIVIYTLKEAELEDKEELKRILEMHTKDEAHRMKAISIIRKYGSIEYARNLAARILEDGWNEVSNILPSSKAKETLRMFSEYLIKRQI